ncbi:hypothetical protein IMX26_17380 [Clostridium sp. 'deep sea']|uniref:hypothetical protein n=1 Tax=Clostridium sp. 'deep sea' TaxID=2779445 RepID=UPI001896887C|nr:hypothetical protein [Clostridium sp. 'deep sea']QOR35203.1 hypothetical protein IMX26_17380 [Clostridium sp. 'deep sea']
MKKSVNCVVTIFIIISVIILTSTLTACTSSFIIKSSVTIDNITYRNGFYGDLWPNNFTFKDDSSNEESSKFRHVNCDKFDLVHSYIGFKASGILYCAENEWKQASEYYAANNNFDYYCHIGGNYADCDPVKIPNIDYQKFNELMSFAKENDYNPFGSNDGVETQRLPFPDENKSPKLVFYKESKDGLFNSFKGYIFHILDGKLLQVYFYDYGHGEYEEMVYVNVPDEIAQYFIELLKQLDEKTS